MPPRAPSALLAYPRADQRGGDSVGLNRLGGTDRLCETLSSWRLLVGGLSPGASHHSFTTSSEEPPLSNFNSYRDIPGLRAADVSPRRSRRGGFLRGPRRRGWDPPQGVALPDAADVLGPGLRVDLRAAGS